MLTQVDIKRLPSYEIGYEDGEVQGKIEGKVEGKVEARQAIVRQLLQRFDVVQVANFLDLKVDEVQRIAADSDTRHRRED